MEASSSSASPSSSYTSQQVTFAYDVFLSFRGEDTRKAFTGHLYKMLTLHGIATFIDNVELEAGDKITKLFEHIQHSEIFVVVMSENYGNSTWCLREISKIVQTGRLIIPVFINVDPSNVRKQDGAFGYAFSEKMKHEKAEDIETWRKALKVVGELSGYVLKDKTDGDEAALIELITKHVVRRVKKPLDVAKHPVSIDIRVEHVLQRLPKDKDNKVSILAIAGIGGIGKSTLARGLYNRIMRDFDVCCFLVNIRDTTLKKGLVSLQKQLVHDIVNQEPFVDSIDKGKSEIKRVLLGKKVLMVLDDVDHKDQLDALAAEKDWFSNGSIVVITTRNNCIAEEHYQSDTCFLCEPPGLNESESMLLFNLHAFMTNKPPKEYEKISLDFVKASHGLPLALTIYGSQLFTKRGNMKYWVDFLKMLEKIPHDDVFARLRLSYDDLSEREKEVFLDIAKFYVGEKPEYPMYIWEARGLYPTVAVQTLVERNLIKFQDYNQIGGWNIFWMHDHIRDMAKYIMSQEKTTPIISNQDELRNAFENPSPQQEKLKCFEGIVCKTGYNSNLPPVSLSDKVFDSMPNLQILRIWEGVEWPRETCLRFPSRLRWLELKLIGVEEFPWDDLNLEHLVVLDLHFSGFKRFKGSSSKISSSKPSTKNALHIENELPDRSFGKRLDKKLLKRDKDRSVLQGLGELRVLDLCGCQYLEDLPDLRRCPKLMELNISGCDSLRRFDGCHIAHLQSLRHFYMNDCMLVETLPALPESLSTFYAVKCKSLSIIPDLSNLVNLEVLDLDYCENLANLPSLRELKALKRLSLFSCIRLKTLPDSLPESLVTFRASYCYSLCMIHDISNLVNLQELNLEECRNLTSIPGLQELIALRGDKLKYYI